MAACNACSARFAVAVAGKKSFRNDFRGTRIIARFAETRRVSPKVNAPRQWTSSRGPVACGIDRINARGYDWCTVKPQNPAALSSPGIFSWPPPNPTPPHDRLLITGWLFAHLTSTTNSLPFQLLWKWASYHLKFIRNTDTQAFRTDLCIRQFHLRDSREGRDSNNPRTRLTP